MRSSSNGDLTNDFSKLKKGDELLKVMDGLVKDNPPWTMNAEIIEVTETTIICIVEVDQWRTMTFDRKTGVDVEGRDYGWLEFPGQCE